MKEFFKTEAGLAVIGILLMIVSKWIPIIGTIFWFVGLGMMLIFGYPVVKPYIIKGYEYVKKMIESRNKQ